MSATAFQRARRIKALQEEAEQDANKPSDVAGTEHAKDAVETKKAKKAGDSDAS